MSEIRHQWVKEQVWEIANTEKQKDDWIAKWLENLQKKGGKIVSAQDVYIIQNALKHLGYSPGKLDGVYKVHDATDSNTIKSVIKLQNENGLAPDGQVWPKTLAKLVELLKATPVSLESVGIVTPSAPVSAVTQSPTVVAPEASAKPLEIPESAKSGLGKFWITLGKMTQKGTIPIEFAKWRNIVFLDIEKNVQIETVNATLEFQANTASVRFENDILTVRDLDGTVQRIKITEAKSAPAILETPAPAVPAVTKVPVSNNGITKLSF